MILKIILIAFAAICKALVDTIAFHKGGKLKGSFWDINHTGIIIPFTKYHVNGFHIMNSVMIVFFCMAAFGFTWKIAVAGLVFNIVFNLFWNKLLN